MTYDRVPNPTSDLQVTVSHPLQFGRRAYGCHRRMSQATVVRNIVESIITHRQLGQDRPISHYTPEPDTQALVKTQLDALVVAVDEAAQAMLNPPDLLGF